MLKKNFESCIEKSLLAAKNFFERNLIAIKSNENTCYYGFPVSEGKKRITEWGATSAGLRSLLSLGISSPDTQSKCELAKEWLLRQQKDGAWEASDFFSAEATAGVLLDLLSVQAIDDSTAGTAIKFLNSCYRDGHYISTPTSTEKPHIYTTYLVTKCLANYGRLEKKTKIKNWILNSQIQEGRWGKVPNSNIDSLIHTIYSYQILFFCGMDHHELLLRFQHQIKSVLKATINLDYVYEEIEVAQQLSNSAGLRYNRLRIQHFVLPVLGKFSVMMGDKGTALAVAGRLLDQQFAGGWGTSNDELVMWATAQAIEYLQSFETAILCPMTTKKYVLYRFNFISYSLLKALITFAGLLLLVIFLLIPGYRENCLVGLLLMIVPWFFARKI
jgi:hypothetical protein